MKFNRFLFLLVFLIASNWARSFELFENPILLSDTVIKISAHSELGFNFPYYLRIPRGVNERNIQYLLVETNNSGNNDSLSHHELETYREIIKNYLGSSICENLKVPFLMPVFPRSAQNWKIYTHAFDKDAANIKNGPEKRLDLQLIAMCKHAKEILQEYGIVTAEKILLNGFSASGTFANRFTAIHPEIVAGVACGGINAIPILPIKKLNGKKLDYPLGVADFNKVFGNEFDFREYQKVPQFIYMGAMDNNDAARFDDAYSKKERQIIFKQLSETMLPDRFARCEAIYVENNTNVSFKTYPGIGHGTDQLIFMEVFTFFKKIVDSI